MNINYGLLPPLAEAGPRKAEDGRKLTPTERGRAKKRLMSIRALGALDAWAGAPVALAAE
jgi:methylenetetrahydrofolate--tRNA-(uracil-5-)-methyltransferase